MIIAISGRIGSGKDTVGSILQFLMHTEGKWEQQYFDDLQKRPTAGVGFNFQNYWPIKKFAGKLKTIASLLTGIPVHRFEDQEFKNSALGKEWNTQVLHEGKGEHVPNFMTVRQFLQLLGTEAIKQIDDELVAQKT